MQTLILKWRPLISSIYPQSPNEPMSSLRDRIISCKELTEFQKIVYLELLTVPSGQTISYSELARRIAAAMDCYVDIVPNNKQINMTGHIVPEEHKKWMITAKRNSGSIRIASIKMKATQNMPFFALRLSLNLAN